MAFTVAELITRLGYTLDDSKLKQFNDQINKTANETIKKVSQIGIAVSGALIAVTASTFGNFETSLNETRALIQNQITDTNELNEAMSKLEAQAVQLGAKTKFSAKQAADAQANFARKGFEVKDILDALPGTLNLAAAANLDVGRAADISGELIKQFGLQARDAGMVGDLLAKAAGSANLTVEDLSESLKFAGPVAKASNQSLQETLTVLNLMADSGIKASLGGTALRSSLIRLQKPPKMARTELEKLNLQIEEGGKMKPFSAIIKDLSKKMAGYTETQKTASLAAIFGTEAVSGILAVINAGEAGIDKMSATMADFTGSADKMAKTMNSGLNAEFGLLKSAAEGAFISIGKQLAPVLIMLLKSGQKVLNWITEMSPETHKLIAMILLLTAALSAGLVAWSSWLLAGPQVTAIFLKLKTAILGVRVSALAMWGALALGLVILGLLIQDFMVWMEGGDSALGRLAAKFPLLASILEDIRNWINQNKQQFMEWGAQAVIAFQMAFAELSKFVTGGIEILSYIFPILLKILQFAFYMAQAAGTVILSIINFIINLFAAIPTAITNFESSVIMAFKQIGKAFMDWIVTPITNFFGKTLGGLVSGAFNAVSGLFGSGGQINVQAGGSSVGQQAGVLNSAMNNAATGGVNLMDALGAQAPGPKTMNNEQNNQIENNITVNVAGTDAQAGDIASAVSGASGNSTQKALTSAYRNQSNQLF